VTLVYVGIPVLDGKPYAALVDSLLAEQLHCQSQGVHLLVEWEVGCSLIGDARNRLAKRFLATTECKAMVFVDADISWPPGSLLKLVKSRKDVIGATYRSKQDDVHFHVHGRIDPVGKLYAVGGLPGGFIKISRRAFGQMKPKGYLASDNTVTHDYFPMGFHRGTYYGEDYGFCRLYRQSGGTVWLDPSIQLRHHDGLRHFTGDPAEWLRATHGDH
jgi:hypothetical protein